MKGLRIRIIAGVGALGVLFYILACSPGGQNGNQALNQAPNQEQANYGTASVAKTPESAMFRGSDEDACGAANIATKRQYVEDRIKIKIWEDDELTKMFEPHPTKPELGQMFELQVIAKDKATPQHLQVRFIGQVNWNDQFDDLINKMDDFLKKGCVHKFSFYTKRGGSGPLPASYGFEWTYCEWPKQACNDGECRENCGTDPDPGGTANISTNANSGSNSGGNYNANVNSSSNANANGARGRP